MNKKDGEFMFGPPPHPSKATDKLKEPKPKSLREVPGYPFPTLRKILFPPDLYVRARMGRKAVDTLRNDGEFDICGFIPIIGAFISAGILNALADVITGNTESFKSIAVLSHRAFAYLFATSLIDTLYSMLMLDRQIIL